MAILPLLGLLAFCIAHSRAQQWQGDCISGSFELYHKTAMPGTPFEKAEPPIRVLEFTVTEEGQCAVSFYLDDLHQSGFSALYTAEDFFTELKLYDVDRIPIPFNDDFGEIQNDLTLSVLLYDPIGEIVTMLWERGVTKYASTW
ncbi:hypothetical protein FOZ63_032040 [Perkinsus olseni]|uniref:Uncharacterized protein n=1 Tax=Perkinsus olseni TaxID=32597 RepID=A0A7J6RW58_PEROL|nr:hypothetical protein FOZ63_032040 [Perkinsus olseni]KAF4724010.1 hypothetical protein FOZ62_003528 [Perkinsus olseni]